ncbi:hypothetical protein VNO77_33934 [Canavalia gladiata]|uniref:Uncharacterized protein n=1 Tax=Canavalia gladiata TaxID=3824 RepID=A0AAN9KFM4_CANGL
MEPCKDDVLKKGPKFMEIYNFYSVTALPKQTTVEKSGKHNEKYACWTGHSICYYRLDPCCSRAKPNQQTLKTAEAVAWHQAPCVLKTFTLLARKLWVNLEAAGPKYSISGQTLWQSSFIFAEIASLATDSRLQSHPDLYFKIFNFNAMSSTIPADSCPKTVGLLTMK